MYDLRQVERKCAPGPRRALQPDLAAEQTGEFAADGESQARAAILPAGGSVGLLERFEDDALLFRRNADAGIGYRERDHALGAVEDRMTRAPTFRGRSIAQFDRRPFR